MTEPRTKTGPEWTTARAEVPGTLISDYCLHKVEQPKEVILLLHGYSLTAQSMMERFAHVCPADAVILAPNGPFPIPERKADGSFRVGFSWYFYNGPMDDYYIDMRVAIELLRAMVAQLGLGDLPKRIVGFSQGGYLAPFAALALGQVRQVVGIASEYMPEEFEGAMTASGASWPLEFRMDAIHGTQDEIVSADDALKGHQEMLARGAQGRFVSLEGETHRMTIRVQQSLRELFE